MGEKQKNKIDWKKILKIQSGLWGLTGFLIGFVIQSISSQVYFAGILVVFFILIGENRGMVQEMQQGRKERDKSNVKKLFFLILTYVLSGIFLLF